MPVGIKIVLSANLHRLETSAEVELENEAKILAYLEKQVNGEGSLLKTESIVSGSIVSKGSIISKGSTGHDKSRFPEMFHYVERGTIERKFVKKQIFTSLSR